MPQVVAHEEGQGTKDGSDTMPAQAAGPALGEAPGSSCVRTEKNVSTIGAVLSPWCVEMAPVGDMPRTF